MQSQAPWWFVILCSIGMLLFGGWLLTWAWALSLTAIFHVVQIAYWQAVGLLALLAVGGGFVFRLIPMLLLSLVPHPTPPPDALVSANADAILQGMQQMLNDINNQPVNGQFTPPAVGQKDEPKPVAAPVPEKPKLDHLKLKDGPAEWDE